MRSIRFRATLLICGFLVVVIAACSAAAYREMRHSALRAERGRLHEVSGKLARALGASADRIEAEVSALAEDPAIVAFLQDPTSAGPVLEALRASNDGVSSPAGLLGTELRDATGRRVLSAVGSRPRHAERYDPDLLRYLRTSAPTALTPFRVAGDTVAYAVLGRVRARGATVGFVVRWRRLNASSETLGLIRELIGSEARVLLGNSRGDVWTDLSRPVRGLGIQPERLAGAATYVRPGGGKALVACAEVAGSPWKVIVELPLGRVLAGPRAVLRGMALFGLLLLLAGAGTAWVLSGRLTGSIVELADAARAISVGDYTRRTSIRGSDEIGTLAGAFNRMADSVAASQRELQDKIAQLAARRAAHRQTQARLEQVVASSRAILYTLRIDGRAVTLDWISDNAERELGYDVDTILTPGWWKGALHPDDARLGVVLDDMPPDDGITQVYRLRHANGHYRWFRDEQRVLRDDEGRATGLVGVLSDVTEQRRLEVAKETAEAANRAKSEFLSRMSHELRTPLNAILGFGQLLELDVETAENRESAEQIVKAGKHLLALVDEVLDIARIEAGKMSLSVEPVSASTVVHESLDLVRLAAAERGITLRAEDAIGAEPFVMADSQRLKQVLLNLLSNAIKYNRPDGTVTLSWLAGEEHLRIVVADTGHGIDGEKQKRLFTPFERLGADRTGVEGTGLGLALSRGLVEAMGGQMGVESECGKGSRFWVDLALAPPLQPSDVGAVSTRAGALVATADSARTVLLVEDNLANVRLMTRLFQRRPNIQLLTAMQGRLGLQLARERRPDLILLDLNLPDLSGDRVLLELRRDPALREIPVVMISGDAIPSHARRMLDLGAQGYLTKPFDVKRLFDVVDASL